MDYFITGTDTGAGKTMCSACVMRALRIRGVEAVYMKPVQTGCEQQDGALMAPDIEFIRHAVGPTGIPAWPDACPYRFRLPASPHLAAAQENTHIEMCRIMESFYRLQEMYPSIIVEGAGGVLVPLNERDTMLDVMKHMGLPVLITCRAGLGTLNHTLLTIQCLQDGGLHCAGLIIVGTEAPNILIEADNLNTLKRMTRLPVIGVIPYDEATARREINRPFLDACAATMELPC